MLDVHFLRIIVHSIIGIFQIFNKQNFFSIFKNFQDLITKLFSNIIIKETLVHLTNYLYLFSFRFLSSLKILNFLNVHQVCSLL